MSSVHCHHSAQSETQSCPRECANVLICYCNEIYLMITYLTKNRLETKFYFQTNSQMSVFIESPTLIMGFYWNDPDTKKKGRAKEEGTRGLRIFTVKCKFTNFNHNRENSWCTPAHQKFLVVCTGTPGFLLVHTGDLVEKSHTLQTGLYAGVKYLYSFNLIYFENLSHNIGFSSQFYFVMKECSRNVA